MRHLFGHQLYAGGEKPMPEEIVFADTIYRLKKVFKHDFFAATALYESNGRSQDIEKSYPTKVVLKLGRRQHFLGLPLVWLGKIICHHELSNLNHLNGLGSVPRVLSLYGDLGIIYEYIDGHSLDEGKDLPNDFFDKLLDLLQQVHQQDIVYLDMNKRGNILVGSDGQPRLIDFQISLYIGPRWLISRRLSSYVRNILQKADIYHVLKHKRRLCPELLEPHEQTLAYRRSRLIRLHRLAATPFRKLRRLLLKYLHTNDLVATEKNAQFSPENDPNRFM